MKKILKIGMLCLMCMMLAACGKTDKNVEPTEVPTVTAAVTQAVEPTATPSATQAPTATVTPEPTEAPIVDEYTKGTLTETGFESEWMGIRFNAPATVILATQEELDAAMLNGLKLMYGENAEVMFDYATMSTVSEMQAVWLLGAPVVQVIVEKMPEEGVTEEEYLEGVCLGLQAAAEAGGFSYTMGETTSFGELGGQEFVVFKVSADAGTGKVLYQDFYVKEKQNRMITVSISYYEGMEKYYQEAIDAFAAY